MNKDTAQIMLADATDLVSTASAKIGRVSREYGLAPTLAPLEAATAELSKQLLDITWHGL